VVTTNHDRKLWPIEYRHFRWAWVTLTTPNYPSTRVLGTALTKTIITLWCQLNYLLYIIYVTLHVESVACPYERSLDYYTRWAKKVIPLVHYITLYERYHFFGPPCTLGMHCMRCGLSLCLSLCLSLYLSVCLSVCWLWGWALQNGWTGRDAVWGRLVRRNEPCIRWGHYPQGKGAIWGLSSHWKAPSLYAKMAKRLELTYMGPMNHVLYGGQVGRIHSPPRAVTGRRCGLLSAFFDH